MAKKKACKTCKRLTEGNECPFCKTSSFANSWQGRISILDADKSEIGKKIGLKEKGEYAIKTR